MVSIPFQSGLRLLLITQEVPMSNSTLVSIPFQSGLRLLQYKYGK